MNLTDGWNLCGIKILDEKTKILPIYFHSIGHYPGQKHVVRPEGLGQYQLSICTKGSGEVIADGKKYEVKCGDLFFLAPDTEHEYYPTDNDWTIIWIVFNGANADSICEYFNWGKAVVAKSGKKEMERIIALCEKMYETYNENDCYDYSLTVYLMEVLGIAAKSKRCEEECVVDASDGFAPIEEYIKKNYSRLISLDDIASVSGLSKSHFCRIFKSHYGVTPIGYLNRYRVSVAKFLLVTTVESIETIAGKTGFSDTSYFCAVFKKFENCSPAQYRIHHTQ